jgi:hypothetical protein
MMKMAFGEAWSTDGLGEPNTRASRSLTFVSQSGTVRHDNVKKS